MKKICDLKLIKCSNVLYTVLECIITVYIASATIINLLNIMGVLNFYSWFMKPTFFGHGLLVLFLLEYNFMNFNRHNTNLAKIRPFAVGALIAGVISTCSLSLCFLLLLMAGCFVLIGYKVRFDAKELFLTALSACVGMEIYSIVFLVQGVETGAVRSSFMGGIWLDVLFVLVAIIYCIIDREPKTVKTTEETVTKKWIGIRMLSDWLKKHSILIVRFMGGILCTLSLGVFLFCLVSTVAGANKIAGSGEEVYLLQNCEDTSLVLTLAEDGESERYNVSFQKYTGGNNQKVRLITTDDEMYQLVFLEPEYALDAERSEDKRQILLKAEPIDDSFEQRWRMEIFDETRNMYAFHCLYGLPLCYEILSQTEDIPVVSVQADTGGYEFFTMERTVADEFVTKMVEKHYDEFSPTLLMETLISYMGAWSCVLFIFIVLAFLVILYMRRFIGDALAGLNAIIFAYLLAYGAISAIALFMVAFVLQCMVHVSAEVESKKV